MSDAGHTVGGTEGDDISLFKTDDEPFEEIYSNK
jgi:hypothetical protein